MKNRRATRLFLFVQGTVNIQHQNIYRCKSSSSLDFIEYRQVKPTDLHTLLYDGSYVVIPDLMKEVSEYLGCTVPGLSKMMRVRSAADKRGSTVEIDLSQLSSTPVNMVYAKKNYPATAPDTTHDPRAKKATLVYAVFQSYPKLQRVSFVGAHFPMSCTLSCGCLHIPRRDAS